METVTRRGRPTRQLDNPPNNLRRLRESKGYTCAEIARLLEVTPQAVSDAEINGTMFTRRKLYRLADLYGCDPRELENFSENYQVKS